MAAFMKWCTRGGGGLLQLLLSAGQKLQIVAEWHMNSSVMSLTITNDWALSQTFTQLMKTLLSELSVGRGVEKGGECPFSTLSFHVLSAPWKISSSTLTGFMTWGQNKPLEEAFWKVINPQTSTEGVQQVPHFLDSLIGLRCFEGHWRCTQRQLESVSAPAPVLLRQLPFAALTEQSGGISPPISVQVLYCSLTLTLVSHITEMIWKQPQSKTEKKTQSEH